MDKTTNNRTIQRCEDRSHMRRRQTGMEGVNYDAVVEPKRRKSLLVTREKYEIKDFSSKNKNFPFRGKKLSEPIQIKNRRTRKRIKKLSPHFSKKKKHHGCP